MTATTSGKLSFSVVKIWLDLPGARNVKTETVCCFYLCHLCMAGTAVPAVQRWHKRGAPFKYHTVRLFEIATEKNGIQKLWQQILSSYIPSNI